MNWVIRKSRVMPSFLFATGRQAEMAVKTTLNGTTLAIFRCKVSGFQECPTFFWLVFREDFRLKPSLIGKLMVEGYVLMQSNPKRSWSPWYSLYIYTSYFIFMYLWFKVWYQKNDIYIYIQFTFNTNNTYIYIFTYIRIYIYIHIKCNNIYIYNMSYSYNMILYIICHIHIIWYNMI